MQIQFTFRKMGSSEALQNYAEKKINAEIQKFVAKPGHAHVTFSTEGPEHIVKFNLAAGDGFNVDFEERSIDMYASVDKAVDKLARILLKKKSRLKGHKTPAALLRKIRSALQPKQASVPEEAFDAGDILKFEKARRRKLGPAVFSA